MSFLKRNWIIEISLIPSCKELHLCSFFTECICRYFEGSSSSLPKLQREYLSTHIFLHLEWDEYSYFGTWLFRHATFSCYFLNWISNGWLLVNYKFFNFVASCFSHLSTCIHLWPSSLNVILTTSRGKNCSQLTCYLHSHFSPFLPLFRKHQREQKKFLVRL